MQAFARVIDANANRAREAMRVLEDYSRFVLDNTNISTELKSLRHDFKKIITQAYPDSYLEVNRDTRNDVGTQISTATESVRLSLNEVIIAAAKRLSEALRTLEEYTKIGNAAAAAEIEALRYRGYDIERRLHQFTNTGRAKQWKLCVLLTESLCHPDAGDWLDVLDAIIEAGADCIQLREKNLDDGKLLGRSVAVVERCHAAGITAIINDRPDIAILANADGVHVGQKDLSVYHVRQLVGKQLIVGVSTSNIVQAEAAVLSGADYCGVGPMFSTNTKIKPELAGPEYLKQYISQNISLPHLAIGGISVDNITELTRIGVRGIAVSSAVCGVKNPCNVVKTLMATLENKT